MPFKQINNYTDKQRDGFYAIAIDRPDHRLVKRPTTVQPSKVYYQLYL